MTDKRFNIFVAVAEEGSITEAARRLHLSQPAVSQCVAQLEAEAGGPLVTRLRSGVALTPLGERFLHHARRILASYDALNSELSGAPIPVRTESFELADGKVASVSVSDGKLSIEISG